MPELSFHIEDAASVAFAAAPTLAFGLRVKNAVAGQKIHTIALRCQLQIEVTRRQYSREEKELLRDLFGPPEQWSRTLRDMLWTQASVVVPQFVGETTVALQVPCTFDFNVAATKLFHALASGDIPLCFQFSGTVFYRDHEEALQVSPIPWDREARFKLPVKVWQELIDHYYPNSAWLCLRRDVFDRLYQYKVEQGIPTWEQALEKLLRPVHDEVLS